MQTNKNHKTLVKKLLALWSFISEIMSYIRARVVGAKKR